MAVALARAYVAEAVGYAGVCCPHQEEIDAEATLKQLQDTMEYVSDDYYDLLVSPDSLDDQAGQGKERKRKVTKRK